MELSLCKSLVTGETPSFKEKLSTIDDPVYGLGIINTWPFTTLTRIINQIFWIIIYYICIVHLHLYRSITCACTCNVFQGKKGHSMTSSTSFVSFHAGVQISIFCFLNLIFRVSPCLLNWSMTLRFGRLSVFVSHDTW